MEEDFPKPKNKNQLRNFDNFSNYKSKFYLYHYTLKNNLNMIDSLDSEQLNKGSNKQSKTSMGTGNVFMLKINKTPNKEASNSLDSLSVANLKGDFDFEYKLRKNTIDK